MTTKIDTQTPADARPVLIHRGLRLGLLGALACLALAFGAVSASAVTSRLYQSSFGSFPDGNPSGIAVDQSTGDVYVVSEVSGTHEFTVSRFDSSSSPKDFTQGPDAGTNTLTGLQGVVGRESPPNEDEEVAIDNSGGPMNGTIYIIEGPVAGHAEGSIRMFSSSGASLGAIVHAGAPPKQGEVGASDRLYYVCGVAVDQSNGDLYVSELHGAAGHDNTGHIWRYEPIAAPAGAISESDYALTGIEVEGPCGLAADSGKVYVDRPGANAGKTLFRYSASDFGTEFSRQPPAVEVDSGLPGVGVTAVAVDAKTGEVYADEANRIAVFDSSGTLLYKFGEGAYFGAGSDGVAVKSAASGPAGKVYVADPFTGRQVDAFGATTLTAKYTHREIASFGPDGTAGSVFGYPQALAFDQASRRIYVGDGLLNNKSGTFGVYGFDASGTPSYAPLAAFDPLTAPQSPVNVAVDNSGLGSDGNLYFDEAFSSGLLYGYGSSGLALGGAFPIDPASNPGAPDGSPKNLCGTAVDSAGNVLVANQATKRILKYSSAGVFQGSIDTAAQGEPCQVAIDSNDDLYVEIKRSGVWKYTAASGYTTASAIAAEGEQNGGSLRALAVDPSTHHVYLGYLEGTCGTCTKVPWIDEYDTSGQLLDEFAILSGAAFSGVTVDGNNHDVYVSDYGGARQIRVFAPGVLLPEVVARAASEIGNTSVKLNGTVVTQEVALSDCHFEYVGEAAFRASGFSDLSSGGSVPCSPAAGSIPLDLQEHSVSATAGGLSRDTAYRFRLVATNANGTVTSEDLGFVSAGRPLVETTGTPLRTTTTARLLGRVDPLRSSASYHFEYGSEGPCDTHTCASTPSRPAGEGNLTEFVSEQVEGLAPNTTYHYRLVADNGNPDGAADGADETVTTRTSEEPLSHGNYPGPPGSDRAYEMASMPDSGGNPVAQVPFMAEGGERAVYSVAGGTPISESGSLTGYYLSERPVGEHPTSGWETRLVEPKLDEVVGKPLSGQAPIFAALGDLSSMLLVDRNEAETEKQIWRLSAHGSPVKLFQTAPGQHVQTRVVQGFGKTARAAVFLQGGTLDPEYPAASATFNLYDVASGSPKLLSLLPGNAVAGCGVLEEGATFGGAYVDDSLAVFASKGDECGGEAQLYVRDLKSGETREMSGSPVSGPSCQAGLIKVAGGSVFFATATRLDVADDAPASCVNSAGMDVYRYDLAGGTVSCVTCRVPGVDADVTVKAFKNVLEPWETVAVSDDASRLYLTSSRPLVEGAPSGTPAAYRVDVASGSLAYVAPTSNVAVKPDQPGGISPDGTQLLFVSSAAGINQLGGASNGGTDQLYLYDDADRSLVCASCHQDGSSPVASVAGEPNMSEDGVFAFATPTPLVSADQNTASGGSTVFAGTDVYEWRDGRLLLVTDGLTKWPAQFGVPYPIGISRSGRDLFFTAAAQYTPDAVDSYTRLYDARVGGGIDFPPVAAPCALEVCQGTPKGAPEEQAPGTSTYSGPGNVTPAPGGGAVKPKSLTRAQKLARALVACRHERQKRKRKLCEARARKRYGTKSRKASKRRSGR